MASYPVPTWNPAHTAQVGWSTVRGSFWFIIFRSPLGENLSNDDVVLSMGYNDPLCKITNVGELLIYSWSELDWNNEAGLYAARGVRDDAVWSPIRAGRIKPRADLIDFATEAFDPEAIAAFDDEVSADRQDGNDATSAQVPHDGGAQRSARQPFLRRRPGPRPTNEHRQGPGSSRMTDSTDGRK